MNVEIFNDELPKALIISLHYSDRMARVLLFNNTVLLAISPPLLNCSDCLKDTMIHEMIHVWMNLNNISGDPHGQSFVDKANELAVKFNLPEATVKNAEEWFVRQDNHECPVRYLKISAI